MSSPEDPLCSRAAHGKCMRTIPFDPTRTRQYKQCAPCRISNKRSQEEKRTRQKQEKANGNTLPARRVLASTAPRAAVPRSLTGPSSDSDDDVVLLSRPPSPSLDAPVLGRRSRSSGDDDLSDTHSQSSFETEDGHARRADGQPCKRRKVCLIFSSLHQ
jgi:hypothetical protein